jgi:hypothetical protein
MSWIMQLVASFLVALGFGPLAKEMGLKIDPAPAASVRTVELGDALNDFGYKTDKVVDNDKVVGYTFDLNTGEYDVPMTVRLSDDEQSITLTANLSPIGDLEGLKAADLETLLAQNNLEESPYVIGVNDQHELTLQITQPITEIDASQLQDALAKFQEAVDYSALRYFFLTPSVDDFAGTVPAI